MTKTNTNSNNSKSTISNIKEFLIRFALLKYIRFLVLFLLLSIFGLAFVSDSVKSKIKPKNSDKKEVSSSTSDKSIYDKVPIINSRTIAQAEDADKPHMLVAWIL